MFLSNDVNFNVKGIEHDAHNLISKKNKFKVTFFKSRMISFNYFIPLFYGKTQFSDFLAMNAVLGRSDGWDETRYVLQACPFRKSPVLIHCVNWT